MTDSKSVTSRGHCGPSIVGVLIGSQPFRGLLHPLPYRGQLRL